MSEIRGILSNVRNLNLNSWSVVDRFISVEVWHEIWERRTMAQPLSVNEKLADEMQLRIPDIPRGDVPKVL